MAERNDNKIEVDLRLMQDKEMDRLAAAATVFQSSAVTIASSLETYADQLTAHSQSVLGMGRRGRGQRGGFGQPNTVAHAMPLYSEAVAERRKLVNDNLRAATITMEVLSERSERQRDNRNSSIPERPGPPNRQSRPAFDLDGNGQQSMGDFIIGSGLLTNPRQAFGLMGVAQVAQAAIKPVNHPEIGPRLPYNYQVSNRMPLIGGRGLSDRVGGTLTKHAVPLATGLGYAMTSFGNRSVYGSLADAQQLGYDVGAQSWGGLGTMGGVNLFTEGGRHAFQTKWSDKLAAVSMSWSGQQQAELRSELTRRGLTNDPSGAIKASAQRGVPIGVTAEFMDTYRRVDPASMKSLGSDMDMLTKAAKAAGMSVEQFAQGVTQATQQITNSTGIGTRAAQGYVTAAGLGGLRPDQAASFANRDLSLMTLARQHSKGNTGLTYYDTMTDPSLNAGTAREMASKMFPAMGDPKHLAWVKKNAHKDPNANRQYKEIMSQMALYGSDPWVKENILQGMTPEEFMSTTGDKKLRAMSYGSQIQKALEPGRIGNLNRGDMRAMLKDVGYGKGAIQDFFEKDFGKGAKGYGNELRSLQEMIGKKSGQASKDKKVQLDLTDRAAKLLKIKDGDDVVNRAANFADNLAPYGPAGSLLSGGLKLGGAIADVM